MKIKSWLLVIGCWLLAASLAFAQAAPDPIRIATGGRTLGMGKAFVGLADDVGSIYLNPAGIANPLRWQITSMSGSLLDEFTYLSLSGLYPTEMGNFGLAFAGSSIGGALPTTIEVGSDPDDPIYVVDTTQKTMSYNNNVFILSYGDKMKRFLQLPLFNAINERLPGLKDANFGANLKMFSVSLTGDHITNSQGSANGMELDLGVQGKPLNWLSLGANLQNALPFSMGGKLHYQSGWDESYPAVLKLGAAIHLIGPEKDQSLRRIGNHSLKILTDMDYEVSRSDTVPALFHVGLEWKPLDLIALRTGIDQEMVGVNETASNLTGGVGLIYGDFRFDYAYHEFAGAPGVANHFFSLSYGIAPVKLIEDKLVATPDKLVTREASVTVSGTAVDKDIVSVKVNGTKVRISPRGEFRHQAELEIGKNSILVEGFDSRGKLVEADKLRVLRLITYPDVTAEYWASEQVGYIGTMGIVKGYPDGNFKPEGDITRAELATLLIRTSAGGDQNVADAVSQVFPDVNLKHWAVKYVNAASEAGIVKGYPDGTFKPSANVTRAEGLTMIARFGQVSEEAYTDEFIDVRPTHWAAKTIAGAYRDGMLIHFKDLPFEPNKKLNRAEAVEMLYRSRPVVLLINDLMDWELGY